MQYFEGIGIENVHGMDSINSGMTDGTHLSLQPQMDATFASQTTRTARKIITSEYQVKTLKIAIKCDNIMLSTRYSMAKFIKHYFFV